MKELLRKFKRLSSVLKVRKLHTQEIAMELKTATDERDQVISELNRQQNLYLKGVTDINQKRQSTQRAGLDLLETYVESVKNEWIALYRKKQELDRQIPIIAQSLSYALKQIEIIEKFRTENKDARNLFIEKKTQEELDFLFSVKNQKGRT